VSSTFWVGTSGERFIYRELPVLVEPLFQPFCCLSGGSGEVLSLVFSREDDPPRGVDEADALAEAELDGGLGVPALGADTGHEEGQVGYRLADRFEFLGRRGTDDETHVVAVVPVGCEFGDALVDRDAVGEFEVLDVGAAGVGGATEDEHPSLGPGEERFQGVPSHVGVDGDGVGTRLVEEAGVLACGVADVAAFGVEQDGDVLAVGVGDGLAERAPAVGVLVEGGVGLVGGRVFVGRVDDPAVERPAWQVAVGEVVGDPVGVGVQPHGDDAVDGVDPGRQTLEEVHTRASGGRVNNLGDPDGEGSAGPVGERMIAGRPRTGSMRGWDSPIRVLHVDDEPDVATLTAEFLEREDERIDVVTATGASEALDLLDEEVDCVVSDQEMPELTGIELLERVRERFPELPFVLFTGQGSEAVASRAISAGVTDYLQKETGTDQYTILANRVTNAVNQYRAQEAVADNERRLRKVLDRIPHPVFVVDEDERYLLSNEAHAASHGCTVSEVEGAMAAEVLEDRFYESFSADLAGVFESGDPLREPEVVAEGPEGTRYYDSRIHPFDDFRPGQRAALGIVVDVTQRKRREQALEALHEVTRELVGAGTKREVAELVVDGVAETLGNSKTVVRLLSGDGTELRPVAVSEAAAAMFGDRPVYEVGEATAGAVFADGETLLVDDVQTVEDQYPRGDARATLYVPIGRHGVLSIGETEVGAFDQWDVHLAEVFAANAAVALDLVEQGRERERQNDRLEEFTSIVSHDLRNPLNALSVTLDLIEPEADPTHVERCRRSVARMERLVEDLLALAREGTIVTETEPLALENVAADSWHAVPTGEAELRIETDAVVHADPDRLRQFLENLFRNSVEHGHRNGDSSSTGAERTPGDLTVTVDALEDGFVVEDDGSGIPVDERERVFETGYSTAEKGTGLGLAIVDRIAEAHGWEVTLAGGADGDSADESGLSEPGERASNRGTRFEVRGVEIES